MVHHWLNSFCTLAKIGGNQGRDVCWVTSLVFSPLGLLCGIVDVLEKFGNCRCEISKGGSC